MSTTRLRRYRRFSTLPDSLALVALLRLNAIEFETRYQQGVNYNRARHEPDWLEIWIRAADYNHVKQLEAALTREQALVLAARYQLITLPDDELRKIVAQADIKPADAAAAADILRVRIPYQPAVPLAAPIAPALAESPRRLFFALLILAGLTALTYYWSK